MVDRVVGCFMEHGDKFIILKRHAGKPYGGTWGLPAGKVDDRETDINSMLREIKEEIGYDAAEDELELLGVQHWEFPQQTVDFVTFRIKLKEKINVVLQPDEHSEFRWVTPEECYALPNLISGFRELLDEHYM